MSSIKGFVTELKSLRNEIKIQSVSLKDLRKKARGVEENIQKYLEAKDQKGLRYQGIAIILDNKESRRRKKKDEQLEDSISVLKRYEVEDPKKIIEELIEARKGSPQPKSRLKLTKYKE
jgi:regulator of sigma D